ncbi:MAG: suppressor protein [Magnetospirillum sp.]|nr:MAG: suppressor protein [Magnetospirillum sp.]
MSITQIGGQQLSPKDRLLGNLESGGLAADKATMVAGEIDSAVQSAKSSSSSGRPDRASVREAIEKQLTADVSAGKLTADEANLVRQTLDQFDKRLSEGQSSADGGGKPDPTEMFKTLDSNGDGKLTRDEFVGGRPKDVSEDQAGSLYDSIANGNTDGLTADQFAQGMASQQPPGGGGPPSGGGGGGGSDGSSSKSEVSRTSTTQGAVKTTVITYSDGTKETSTSTSTVSASDDATKSSSDALLDLLKASSASDTSSAADYLKTLLSGGLVDIKA